MKRLQILMISMILAAPLATHAHEGHVHEAALEAAPHGGTLRDAGKFKAEAVIKEDTVRIYVYDQTLKPVQLDLDKAEGDVQFPKQKKKTVTFTKKENAYEATIKGIGKVHRYDLHVNLNIKGEKVLADFGIDNIQ